jgi:hypothetical protein
MESAGPARHVHHLVLGELAADALFGQAGTILWCENPEDAGPGEELMKLTS